ncbi:MAG: hypothetical protein K2W96_17385 [Gemmataceae bacterium]|nr:hypothetical protein [Gemmataceae bacterium]
MRWLPLVLLAGCGGGPRLAPVAGKVSMAGRAVTAGSVYLHPAPGNEWKGEPPSSVLQVDGSFTMKTYPYGDGAPLGKWKLTLGPPLSARLGKPELGDAGKSPWTVDVGAEGVKGAEYEVRP